MAATPDQLPDVSSRFARVALAMVRVPGLLVYMQVIGAVWKSIPIHVAERFQNYQCLTNSSLAA